MSDVEQISEVLVRYATGIDSRNWDLFRSCFTEICELDYGPLGQWDSREAITRFMALAHSGPSMHRLSNFAITVENDEARTRTYVDAIVYGPGGWGGAHTIGYYDDELVRNASGIWQIKRRQFSSVSTHLLGIFGIIPSFIVSKLAAIASQRMCNRAAKQ